MFDNDLTHRVKRIYEAIGNLEERDLGSLKAYHVKTEKFVFLHQDFSGGQSNEHLANAAHSLIYNINNLYDHLRRFARYNGMDESMVKQVFRETSELRVLRDLSNSDKHGYDGRPGHSGIAPRLGYVHRIMKLTTGSQVGSWVTMRLGPEGIPVKSGPGSAKAIITADILDKDGRTIGSLNDIADRALAAWEQLLKSLRVG